MTEKETKLSKAKIIMQYFDEILPNASCELEYTTDYSFLIAVMLSAQCTDKKVNKVTNILFNKYRTLEELANASYEDIYNIVLPLGLANHKARNVIEIAQKLLTDFNAKVPINKFELMSLPGVGNKTANVVQVELFKIPQFPVDTHVERIAKRLSIADDKDNVKTVEKKLNEFFPKNERIKLHHQFIHFGRYKCKALSPQCKDCKISCFCKKTV
ncbi:MAG: endonuclease III [Candidatus Onthovivens sp.]|nr:endonuclease III [Candidatus Onthovivens sp.]